MLIEILVKFVAFLPLLVACPLGYVIFVLLACPMNHFLLAIATYLTTNIEITDLKNVGPIEGGST
jgi:hypothetical protein